MTKRNAIAAGRDSLPAGHSTRFEEPLRGSSWMSRLAILSFRSVVYSAIRPFAHWAKPMLFRIAQKPAARKLVVGVFGRHSILTNTARLFLIGAPASSPPGEVFPSPEMLADGKSLSARGREMLSVLADMQAQAKEEAQRASRT